MSRISNSYGLLLSALLSTVVGCETAEHVAGPLAPQHIVNGEPTGAKLYGNVGAVYYDFDRNGRVDGNDLICTGSLIAETVFLTAAHCVQFLPAGSQLYVSFDDDIMPRPSGVIAATGYHWDPKYAHDSGDYHDIAVVLLGRGTTRGISPVSLPSAGALDALAAHGNLSKTLFVNVGYGYDASYSGPPSFSFDGIRKYSKSEFMGLTKAHLGLLMQTNATGEGGDCYGDSGGPKFIDGDQQTIYAIVITGDVPCRSTTWDYRLDTPNARAFLGQFVTLP